MSMKMWDTLRRTGVLSATTRETSQVSAESKRYALTRFLDSESESHIEFEAGRADVVPLV